MNMLFQATEPKRAVLYNVLYVPKLTCNLFSVNIKTMINTKLLNYKNE